MLYGPTEKRRQLLSLDCLWSYPWTQCLGFGLGLTFRRMHDCTSACSEGSRRWCRISHFPLRDYICIFVFTTWLIHRYASLKQGGIYLSRHCICCACNAIFNNKVPSHLGNVTLILLCKIHVGSQIIIQLSAPIGLIIILHGIQVSEKLFRRIWRNVGQR